MSELIVHLTHPLDSLPYCWNTFMARPWLETKNQEQVTCADCLELEAWRPVPDFPRYEIHKSGHVRNARTQYILKPYVSSRNIVQVRLALDDRHKSTTRSLVMLLREVHDINLSHKELIEQLDL